MCIWVANSTCIVRHTCTHMLQGSIITHNNTTIAPIRASYSIGLKLWLPHLSVLEVHEKQRSPLTLHQFITRVQNLRYVDLRYVTLRYVMLCYVMLCYVILYYIMLCCFVMLCYVSLCYVTLRYDSSVLFCSITLCYVTLLTHVLSIRVIIRLI
jgi:hypothetical protein